MSYSCIESSRLLAKISNLSPYSYLSASVILFGYIIQSSAIQYLFYYNRNPKENRNWKIQEERNLSKLGVFWTIPIFSVLKQGRAKNHIFLTTINLINATLFAFIVTELCVKGKSKMKFLSLTEYGSQNVLKDLILAIIYENVAEYYWHRFLHSKLFYKKFHKYHHHIKSPEPWDDMYIHPCEAIIYYIILYSPPFLFSCHYYSFLLYMVIMGLCGTLDHSGVKINIPGKINFSFLFLLQMFFYFFSFLFFCIISLTSACTFYIIIFLPPSFSIFHLLFFPFLLLIYYLNFF